MNPTHLHLVLNHVPVVGLVGTVLLLLLGWLRRSEELQRVAFGFLAVVSLTALPVYFTGEPAEQSVKGLPAVSDRHLEQHRELSQIALAVTLAVGAGAVTALWRSRAGRKVSPGLTLTLLVAGALAFILMAWTANLGGLIRHSEIRPVPFETP